MHGQRCLCTYVSPPTFISESLGIADEMKEVQETYISEKEEREKAETEVKEVN